MFGGFAIAPRQVVSRRRRAYPTLWLGKPVFLTAVLRPADGRFLIAWLPESTRFPPGGGLRERPR